MQRITRVERDEQVLAHRVRVGDDVPVEQNTIPESPLWTGDDGPFTREMTAKLCRDAVNGMALGHT